MRRAERRRLRQLAPLARGRRHRSPTSGSATTGSRSSGAASSPRRASSRAPRSTTTGGWCDACREPASSRSSRSTTSRRRAGSPTGGGWSGADDRRPLRPVLRARRAGAARRLDGPGLHDQRAEHRVARSAYLVGRSRPATRTRRAPTDASTTCSSTRTARRSTRSAPDAGGVPVGLTLSMSDYQAVDGGEAKRDRIRRAMEDVLPRGDRGRRLHRRADLHAARASAPTAAARPGGRRADAHHGLRVLARVARGDDPRAAWDVTGRDADARHRERHRHRRRRRSASPTSPTRARGRAALPSPTASTCAATRTGACSTTSSGRFGYGPTFGLVAVDRTTFERTPKPSARWLGARRPRQRPRLTVRSPGAPDDHDGHRSPRTVEGMNRGPHR